MKNLLAFKLLILLMSLVLTGCFSDNAKEDNPVVTTPPYDDYSSPLTFEAVSGDVTVSFKYNGKEGKTIEYCIDGGSWIPATAKGNGHDNNGMPVYTDIVSIKGKIVQLRGYNATYALGEKGLYSYINCDKDCYIYGNIMSLINASTYPVLKELDNINGEYTFSDLFFGNTHIINHPQKKLVLPAIKLSKCCYSGMFYNCTGITEAPQLPATTLSYSCYSSMFMDCYNLKMAPDLPATILTDFCYAEMFEHCNSLTTAPELPAMSLAYCCYVGMFVGTDLREAPALPAKIMAERCYYYMFSGCRNLTVLPELPATKLAKGCYEHMFSQCYYLKVAPALPATTLEKNCYSHMFEKCDIRESPVLPASILEEGCYENMFYNCDNISKVTCFATDLSATCCTRAWLTPDTRDNCEIIVSPSFSDEEIALANAKNSDEAIERETEILGSWKKGNNGIPIGWKIKKAIVQ